MSDSGMNGPIEVNVSKPLAADQGRPLALAASWLSGELHQRSMLRLDMGTRSRTRYELCNRWRERICVPGVSSCRVLGNGIVRPNLSARHHNQTGSPSYMLHSIFLCNLGARLAYYDPQLDLVVHSDIARDQHVASRVAARRFEEEEGFCGCCVVELFNVVGVSTASRSKISTLVAFLSNDACWLVPTVGYNLASTSESARV